MTTTTPVGLPPLYTDAEIATLLDITPVDVRELLRKHRVPFIRVNARNVKVRQEQFELLLAALTTDHTQGPADDLGRDRQRAQRHAARTATPKPRRTAT